MDGECLIGVMTRTRACSRSPRVSELMREAVVNDEVIYVISQNEFTISTADPANVITGFDVIRKGLTLRKREENLHFPADGCNCGLVSSAQTVQERADCGQVLLYGCELYGQ